MYITLIPHDPSESRHAYGLYALWLKALGVCKPREAPEWEVFGGNGIGRSAYTRPLTTT